MDKNRAAQQERAEVLLAKEFQVPKSPMDAMRSVVRENKVNYRAARKAYAYMLYNGKIRRSDENPDMVVLVTSPAGK